MAPQVKAARLPNGLTLPYAEQGDPDGAPVVLLHGYADSWRSFELVLSFLPDSVHAFAPSQRGHGDADRPPNGYGPESLAADLLGFMDTVGLRAAVLAASSSANFTVQRFALEHPERTLGLVLIGAPWTLRGKPGPAQFMSDLDSVKEPLDPMFVRAFVESTASGLVPRAFVDTMTRESQKVPLRVWKATLRELMDTIPAAETGRITAPTLILYGNRDAFVPRSDQESLTAAIPGSRLVTYDGIGHLVHWDEPRRVASDIARFASRVASRQA
jgi:non-heme chloroperoxidase